MNLEALFNAVIVKPIEQNEEMYGSIVVPDMGKDKNEHGIVVSVGPGQHTHMGHFIPAEINIKSPNTGIHAAKNIAPHPNLFNNLWCFFSCFSTGSSVFDFLPIFLNNSLPPNPIE